MTDQISSARTFMFVPGDRPDRFDKALAAGADVVICDLEDAVAPDRKTEARADVVRWLADGGPAVVRVNAVGDPAHADDVAALTGSPGLTAVMVPKAEDPAALAALHGTLDVPVIALIESARGVEQARAIAATTGVVRLAFGSLDLAADLGCDPEHAPALLAARSELVLASRLGELPPPVDGVTPALDDPAAAGADAAFSRRLGFLAKLCIHPRQVEPVAAAFSPSADDVAWARRVLSAGDGEGAVRVDGELVDGPVLRRATTILRQSGHPIEEEAP